MGQGLMASEPVAHRVACPTHPPPPPPLRLVTAPFSGGLPLADTDHLTQGSRCLFHTIND